MGIEGRMLRIGTKDAQVLDRFLGSLGEELESFRYFNTRAYDVLKNHVYTCLLYVQQKAVGYGHLDQEDDRIWIGIVIKKEWQGHGLGFKMMNHLLDKASELGLVSVHLSVDIVNKKAFDLYRKLGFTEVSKGSQSYILNKDL